MHNKGIIYNTCEKEKITSLYRYYIVYYTKKNYRYIQIVQVHTYIIIKAKAITLI